MSFLQKPRPYLETGSKPNPRSYFTGRQLSLPVFMDISSSPCPGPCQTLTSQYPALTSALKPRSAAEARPSACPRALSFPSPSLCQTSGPRALPVFTPRVSARALVRFVAAALRVRARDNRDSSKGSPKSARKPGSETNRVRDFCLWM